MIKRKKAQVTVFMIVGLILLISIALFFMFRTHTVETQIQPEYTAAAELSVEYLPVKPYVEDCIEDIAKEGLKLAGQRGGYIYTDKLNPSADSTVGDSVRFSPGSELVVPYWHYLSSDNKCSGDCSFASSKLELEGANSLTAHLERYIDENIEDCLGSYADLEELGYTVRELSDPKSEVIIGASNVIVKLYLPLEISSGDSKFSEEEFMTSLDVDIRKIYRLADYITGLQQEYRFLEKSTLNLLVAFSGMDTERLPPMSESSFETANKIRWRKDSVAQQVKDILVSYTPVLRVVGTGNYLDVNTNTLYGDKLYRYGMSIPNNVSYPEMEVSFSYLDFWNMYFDLNCDGQVCQPESAFIDLLPIGLQRYNFAYDISYPVLVEIRDDSAYNGQGYTLNLMLESNIRNNAPLNAEFVQFVDIAEEGNMLCDEDKRASGKVKIRAKDSSSGEQLSDVDVFYSCIDSCYIGTVTGEMLETKLPVCMGGVLSFRKEGYATKYVSFDALRGEADAVVVEMDPKKRFEVELIKKNLTKVDGKWVLAPGDHELGEHESVTVSIRKSSADSDPVYELLEFRKGSNESVVLAPGEYRVDVNVIVEDELYIPPRTEDYDGHEVTSKEVNMSTFVSGITSYDLNVDDTGKSKIVIYALSQDILGIPVNKRSYNDLLEADDLNDYKVKYFAEVAPRLE